MKKMKITKKRESAVAMLIAAGISVTMLNGCGSDIQTQEEVVVSKEQENGQMTVVSDTRINASSGAVAEQVQAPEIYRAEASSDTVRLTAEAEVVIPDVPGIKTKKVTPRVFTQEDYDAVNRVLLGGGTLWERQFSGELPYEEWSVVELPAIVSYDEALSEARKNELYGNVTVNGQNYFVEIDNNATAVTNRLLFLVDKMDGDGNYLSFSNSRPDLEQSDDITPKPGLENMNIPPEEVQAKAEEAIKQMGIGEYAIQGGGYFACWSADEADPSAPTYLAGLGYGMHFVRVVDGIPITYTYEDGGQITGDDVEKYEQTILQKANGEEVDVENALVWWPFEELKLIYNNEGFRTFEWKNPCTIEDLSEDYVFLLPFSDISDIFEEMILKRQADSFNNEGDTVDIQVDKVVLSYMRIREKGSMEGTLIPVWDFFGTKTYKNAAGEVDLVVDRVYDGVLPESMMTINAMDGTIIDRGIGY